MLEVQDRSKVDPELQKYLKLIKATANNVRDHRPLCDWLETQHELAIVDVKAIASDLLNFDAIHYSWQGETIQALLKCLNRLDKATELAPYLKPMVSAVDKALAYMWVHAKSADVNEKAFTLEYKPFVELSADWDDWTTVTHHEGSWLGDIGSLVVVRKTFLGDKMCTGRFAFAAACENFDYFVKNEFAKLKGKPITNGVLDRVLPLAQQYMRDSEIDKDMGNNKSDHAVIAVRLSIQLAVRSSV